MSSESEGEGESEGESESGSDSMADSDMELEDLAQVNDDGIFVYDDDNELAQVNAGTNAEADIEA